MSLKKRIVQTGAGLALASAITAINTNEAEAASWEANSVAEIQASIQNQANGQDGTVEYTFQNGDTLWGISQAIGIPVDKLAQINNIEDSSLITVGSAIYLSENGSVVSVEENSQVKSYDVSEEVVKETETPEEVQEDTSAEVLAPQENRNGQAQKEEQETTETSKEEVQTEDKEETVESSEEEVETEEQETTEDSDEEANRQAEEERQAEREAAAAQEAEEERQAEREAAAAQEAEEERQAEREAAAAQEAEEDRQAEREAAAAQEAESSANQATPSSSTTATAAPAPATSSSSVIEIGESQLGTPYKWAGTSPRIGFDCSGFVNWVFAQAGKPVPRTTSSLMAASTPVSNPQVGDLVFFGTGGNVSHVGIYAGGGQFLGSQTSTGVAYASVHSGYWGQRFMGYGNI